MSLPPRFEPPSRRDFLLRSLAGSAALGAAAWLPAGCASYELRLRGGEPPRVFNAKEFTVLQAVADRMVPPAPGYVPSEQARVAQRVDAEVAAWAPDLQTVVRRLLVLVEHGPQLFEAKIRRFTQLAGEEQDRHLEGWAKSTLWVRRAGFQGLKALTFFYYYTVESTWPQAHYDGPWIGRTP